MKLPKRPYVMTARAEKAAATRQRIIDCVNRLYCAGPMGGLTLEEVAAGSATTVQTVLRIFGSKEALMFAALDALASGGVPQRPTPPGDVAAAVGAIFDIYETMGDLVIRQLADEPRHPALRPVLDRGRANHAEGVRQAFAPQLAGRAGAARTRLFHALMSITDVYVWKLLRRDAGLDRATAETIVREMILGVTRGEATHGTDSLAELVGRREPAAESGHRA